MQSAKAKAQQAQQAKAAVSWQLTMAAKAADLLRSIVDPLLDNPPAATPGKHAQMSHNTLPAGLVLLSSNGPEFGGGDDSCKTPAVTCVSVDSVHTAAVR